MIDITKLNLKQKYTLLGVIDQARYSIANGSGEIMKLTALLDNFMPTKEIEANINNYLFDLDQKLLTLSLEIKQALEKKIGEAQLAYMLNHLDRTMPNTWAEDILSKDADAKNYIISVLQKHTEHRYPALMVDDVCTEFFHAMVSADPFYILTGEKGEQQILSNLGANISKSFIRYRPNRGRYIPLELPKAQLNLILTTQICSMVTFSHISMMLQRLFSLLRPGGLCVCSFIDAESDGGIEMLDSWDFQNQQNTSENDLKPLSNFLTRSYFESRIYKPIEQISDVAIESVKTFDTHTVYIFRKTGNLKTVKNKKTIRVLKAI